MPNYKDLNMYYKDGDLDIDSSELDSLTGCPNHITGNFNCASNNLTDLVGGPQQIDGDFMCDYNELTTLMGAPSKVDVIECNYNNITSLVGIHKIIKICKEFYFDDDKITEGGIGLLMIKDLTEISMNQEPFVIIANYLSTGTKGMMECSKELKAKGYEQYAKL